MPRHKNFIRNLVLNFVLASCSILLAFLIMEGNARLPDIPPKPLEPRPKYMVTLGPIISLLKERLTQTCRARSKKSQMITQFVCVDLVSALKASGKGLYFSRDGHWTKAGNKVVAKDFTNTLVPMLGGK
jgi:hypothetical protein